MAHNWQSFTPQYLNGNSDEGRYTAPGIQPRITESIAQTLDMALADGAAGADILLSEGESHSLKAQDGKISENKISASRIIGIRVSRKDGRMGLSYSESLEEDDRRKMVEMALANAQFTKQDPCQGIHRSTSESLLPDCSAQYSEEDISLEQKEELALQLESGPLACDARVRTVPYNGFGEGRSGYYVANSKGVFCYQRARSYSCYTYLLMEERGHKADYGESSAARRFAELKPEHCISEAVRLASLLLHAGPIASGSYPVIFSTEALASLMGSFEQMYSGFAAKAKTNPMQDKLGQRIASKKLQILDLPRYGDSLHWQFFDAEGSVPEDLILIEDGVLRNWYHNSETAKHFGVQTNARAARAPQGSLGTAGNCMVILPQATEAGLHDGEYLYVLELSGLHSGCDAISGDFSLPCTGQLWRGGELVQGVRDVTLAGNFYQMLQDLCAVGSQLRATASRDFFAPELRFGGLTIAG